MRMAMLYCSIKRIYVFWIQWHSPGDFLNIYWSVEGMYIEALPAGQLWQLPLHGL